MLGRKWYVLLDLVRTCWDSEALVWIKNGTLVLCNIGGVRALLTLRQRKLGHI